MIKASALEKAKNSLLKKITEVSKEEPDKVTEKPESGIDKTQQDFESFVNASLKNQTYPQYLDYNPPTDKELLSLAEKTLKSKKEDEISNAEKLVNDSKNSAYKAINDQIESANNQKILRRQAFGDAIKTVEDQALKRGIARSSAAVNSVASLQKGLTGELSKIDRESQARINALNDQIATLESDFMKELSKIDARYADAIDLKLKELKDERDKKVTDIIKYNNSLARSEATNNSANGGIEKNDLYKIGNVSAYYNTFSDPVAALEDFLKNDFYEEYLGDYYNNVFLMLKNKANLSK